MTQNVVLQAIKSIILDLVGEILYFPIWWYTQGLKGIFIYYINSVKNTNRSLALTIMFKNLFKPMFGQADREGRIISFFMRLILTISRFILFIVLVLVNSLIIVFWVLLPPVVVWGLMTNFSALWK